MPLSEYVPDQVWLQKYPIHFAGCDFDARMAVIRIVLSHGDLIETDAKEVASEAWKKPLRAA